MSIKSLQEQTWSKKHLSYCIEWI